MNNQNLFNAIVDITEFTPLESDMQEIILAYQKDIAEGRKGISQELSDLYDAENEDRIKQCLRVRAKDDNGKELQGYLIFFEAN